MPKTCLCQAALTGCFCKQNSCFHKIYFYRYVPQNSCSARSMNNSCERFFNKVTNSWTATLSKINSFTCTFQWFLTQMLKTILQNTFPRLLLKIKWTQFSWSDLDVFIFNLHPRTSLFFTFSYLVKSYCQKLLFEVWQFWSHFSRLWLQYNCKFITSIKIPGRNYSKDERTRSSRWSCSWNRLNFESKSSKNTYEEAHFQ